MIEDKESDSMRNTECQVLTWLRGGAGDGEGQLAPEQSNKLLNNTEWTLYKEEVIGIIFL